MSKCKVNESGLHTFLATRSEQDPSISTYHTCIACGERRAITKYGELVGWNKDRLVWEAIG